MLDQKIVKIAIVDDDEMIAGIFSRTLEKENLHCTYYETGEGFLKDFRKGIFHDVVLLDVHMPGVSGHGVLNQIRSKFKPIEMPVILLTGEDDTENIVKALSLGANDYIIKPTEPRVAFARINTQINLKKYHEEILRKTELETLHSMIVTYNHEINNPLTVAIGNLREDIEKMDNDKLGKVRAALNRIAGIMQSIHHIIESEPYYVSHSEAQKMLDLSKRK